MVRGLRLPCLLVVACIAFLALATPALAIPNRFDTYTRNPAMDELGDPIGAVSSAFIDAIAVDSMGTVYFTESDWYDAEKRVVRLDPDQSRHVLNVGAVGAPTGIAVAPDGTVWVADNSTSEIVGIAPNGDVTRRGSFGEASGPGQDWDVMYAPAGVAVDADGIVYVSDDWPNNRIVRYDPANDSWLSPLGSSGVGSAHFNGPEQIAWADGRLYVAERVNNRISVWDCASASNIGLYSFSDETGHGLDTPCGIAVDGEGTMYVADTVHKRFARINAAGRSLGSWPAAGDPNPLDVPYEIGVAPGGGIWIADQGGNGRPSSLRRFDFHPGIADTAPPYTQVSGTTGSWTRQAITITLHATDASSTIAGTWYSLDGSFPSTLYTDPIYLPDEGSMTLRYFSADTEENTETVRSIPVRVDYTSPVSTATVESNYYGQAVIDTEASDNLSGVNQIVWQIDDGPLQNVETIRYSGEYGPHVLKFWAVDNANNTEIAHVAAFDLHPPDNAAPITTAYGIPSDWTENTVNVVLDAYDSGSGVQGTFYTLDGSSIVETYTGSPVSISADGVHTIAFWSIDDQDNIEPQKSETIKIDRFAPTTLATVKASYNATPVITLVPEDAGTGVVDTLWRVDGAAWQHGTEVVGSSVPGTHTIDWYSVDGMGHNETINSASYLFLNRIEQDDSRAVFTPGWSTVSLPNLSAGKQKTIDAAGSAFLLMEGTRFDFVVSKGPNLGIARVSVDDSAPVDVDLYSPDAAYLQKVAHAEMAPGRHRIRVDWTGRKNPASSGTGIDVDAFDVIGEAVYDVDPPTVTVTGAPGGWVRNDVSLTISAEDTATYVSQLRAGIDGSVDLPCESPFLVSSEGSHTVLFRAVDGAGNRSADVPAYVKIDRTAPVTSDDASATTAGTYQFDTTATITLTADDPQSGPGTTKWRLDGTGVWTTGTNVVIGNNYGAHTLEYYSIDAVGNQELTQTLAFEILSPDTDLARDDNRIVYHDDWGWGVPNAWTDNGSAKLANQSGSAVFVAFNGYRFKWFAQRGPNMGKATVQIDNGTPVTVDLYNSSVWSNTLVYDSYTIANKPHTVAIRWTGTKNGFSSGTSISLSSITVRGAGLLAVTDTVAPASTDNAPTSWVNGPVTVGLTSVDATTGIKAVNLTSDGTTPTAQTPYTGPITISAEGTTTIKYFAEDWRGNKEVVRSRDVRVDNSAPLTTISGLQPSYSSTASVSLVASDPFSGVASTKWRVDAGTWQTGTTITVPNTVGYHPVEWYSIDALGHTETTRSAQVLIGRRYEQSDSRVLFQGAWATENETSASAGSFRSLDGAGASYVMIDGTEFALIAPRGPDLGIAKVTVDSTNVADVDLYSATRTTQQRVYSLAGLAPGVHHVRIEWAGRGNASSTGTKIALDALDTSGQLVADTSMPSLTLNGSVADGVWTKDSSVIITALSSENDSFVNLYATVGASQPTTVTGPITVSNQGETLVSVDAIDGAGNKTTKTYRVLIDRTAPTAADNIPAGWIDSQFTVSLTATDTMSGLERIRVSTDGSVPTARYTDPILISTEGTTTVKYQAVDNLGNAGTITTKYLKIDKSAPVTVPSVAIQSSYQATATINLVATDTRSGVASTKWSVDGGAWQTGTVVTVPYVMGERTIQWYSQDSLGNREATQTAKTVMVKRLEQTDPAIYYQGTWSTVSNAGLSGGTMKSGAASDCVARVTFTGSQLDWITSKNTSYGKARVTLDGGTPVDVDLYGSFAFKQRVWTSGQLANGIHRVKIEYTGSKNASSTGYAVPIDALDVAGDLVADTVAPATQSDALSAWRSAPATVTLTAQDADTWVATTFYRIDGGQDTTYTAPFRVSGEGTTTIDFYSIDGNGNCETAKSAQIRIDRVAPVLTNVFPSGWSRGPVIASLAANDSGCGVASVVYSTDGGDPLLPYTGPIVVSNEGTTTVHARAVDNLGNSTAVDAFDVRIDDSAPKTSDDATQAWVAGTTHVALAAEDTLSGVASTRWSIDGTAAAEYVGPVAVSGEGTHTLSYASVDALGNTETTRSATIRIDDTAPVTRSNAATSYATSAVVLLTPSDALSGVQKTLWRLNGGTWTEGTTVNVNVGGHHLLEWKSLDLAGNTEATQNATFDISRHYEQTEPTIVWKGTWSPVTHPSLSAGSYSYTFTAGSTASFLFSGTHVDWITSKSSNYGKARVTLDGNAPVDVDLYASSPQFKQKVWTSGDIANGLHTVKIEYTGTKNPASAGYTIGVDALDLTGEMLTDGVAPVTTGDFGTSGWSTKPVRFTLSATDASAGVSASYYRLNSGATTTYSTATTVSAEGTTTVSYWSVDRVGNAESTKTATIRVDSQAPTTTAAFDESYPGTATVSLSPTDTASGLADTTWRVDGGAWSHGTTVTATGLGSHTVDYRSTDVAGNVEATKTAAFVVVNRYEQNDPYVALSGTWSNVSHSSLSGGTYSSTYADGSFAEVTFSGSRIDWITSKSTSYGKARVILDGGSPVDVDLYAATAAFKQRVWSSGTIAAGTHTLRIEYTGLKNAASTGTNIGVDALEVVGTLSSRHYEQSDPNLMLLGTWSSLSHPNLSAGSYTYTYTTGSAAYVSFVGTRLDWTTSKSSNYGKARVTIDGTSAADVDLYAPSAAFKQKVWSTGDLPNGVHTIKIENTGAKNTASAGLSIGIDALDVTGVIIQPQVSLATRFEQSDPKIAFGGSWSTVSNSSLSGGSHAYTAAAGSAVLVNFDGTRLDWIASKSTNYGKARVTLDGGAPIDVDLYSATAAFKQKVWTSGDLTSGAHSVKIEFTGTKNAASSDVVVGVDAFDVMGTLTQAVLGPTLKRYEQTDSKLSLTGPWSTTVNTGLSGGSFASGNTSDCAAVVKFTGTKVTLITSRNTSYGIAKVTLDGGAPIDVDLYGSFGFQQAVWASPTLSDQTHTLRIEWTGRKNASSSGTSINVDALDVVGTLVQAP